MKIPKCVIREAQQSAKLNMRDGFSASECWRIAMVDLKWQYHRVHKQAVAYGFIKT